jgi:KaiC/GvpD/RAD55 family RecA-like ATPase
MSNQNDNRVKIRPLPTGVPGLDEILGGGLPEYSFNILAGAPGCGKTTLAHQFLFTNATPESPGLYFTVLGEPAIKTLRYQQQFTFFDPDKLDNGAIRFVNLSQTVLEKDLGAVLEEIVREVEAAHARFIVVDSFRTVVRKVESVAGEGGGGEMVLQSFIQRLALHLTSWQATTFLIGEYLQSELRDNPVFTVADGLLWLYQSVEHNSIVRKIQIMKLRGQESVPGLHTFRITDAGLRCFPRTFGLDFAAPQKEEKLKIIYLRPLDLSVDETVHEVIAAVKRIGARRVVLDSLVGFEMALAPDFRHEFRESLYRMIVALARQGVTVLSTVEVQDDFISLGLSNYAISFLSDDIVRLRYVSINGQLRRMLLVVKMRGGAHSIDMTEFTISGRQVRGPSCGACAFWWSMTRRMRGGWSPSRCRRPAPRSPPRPTRMRRWSCCAGNGPTCW